MNSFTLCIRAVLPAFLVIMAGYASKRAGFVREADIPRMNAMAYRAFMPVTMAQRIGGTRNLRETLW